MHEHAAVGHRKAGASRGIVHLFGAADRSVVVFEFAALRIETLCAQLCSTNEEQDALREGCGSSVRDDELPLSGVEGHEMKGHLSRTTRTRLGICSPITSGRHIKHDTPAIREKVRPGVSRFSC